MEDGDGPAAALGNALPSALPTVSLSRLLCEINALNHRLNSSADDNAAQAAELDAAKQAGAVNSFFGAVMLFNALLRPNFTLIAS